MTQKKQDSSFRHAPRTLKPSEIDQVAGGEKEKEPGGQNPAKTVAGPDIQHRNFN